MPTNLFSQDFRASGIIGLSGEKIYLGNGYSSGGANQHQIAYTIKFVKHDKSASITYAKILFNTNNCVGYCITSPENNLLCNRSNTDKNVSHFNDIQTPSFPSIKYLNLLYDIYFEGNFVTKGNWQGNVDFTNSLIIDINLNLPYSLTTDENGVFKFKNDEELKSKIEIRYLKISEFSYSQNVIEYLNKLAEVDRKYKESIKNSDKKTSIPLNKDSNNSKEINKNVETNKNQDNNSSSENKVKYDQFLEQTESNKQNWEKIDTKIKEITTQLYGTAEERKVEKERKYQEYKENWAKERAKSQQRLNERIAEIDKLSSVANEEFNGSYLQRREAKFKNLKNEAPIEYQDWINTCKIGDSVTLKNYISKYPKGYFTYEAKMMVTTWRLLLTYKTNPNHKIFTSKKQLEQYISIPSESSNWNLVKSMLNYGLNVDYYIETAYGNKYSPIFRLLDKGYFDVEKQLSYKDNDRITILMQMIENGADPNRLYKVDYIDKDELSLLHLIVQADYNGVATKWLLKNNLLTTESCSFASSYLLECAQNQSYNYNSEDYSKMCSDFGYDSKSITFYDHIYILLEAFFSNKSNQISGTFYNSRHKDGITYQARVYESAGGYHEGAMTCWKFPSNDGVGHFKYWYPLQKTIVERGEEVDRTYLLFLSKSLIRYHSEERNCKELLYNILIKTGYKPNDKVLMEGVGNNKQIYSMISFAKTYNPNLVEYLKGIKINEN